MSQIIIFRAITIALIFASLFSINGASMQQATATNGLGCFAAQSALPKLHAPNGEDAFAFSTDHMFVAMADGIGGISSNATAIFSAKLTQILVEEYETLKNGSLLWDNWETAERLFRTALHKTHQFMTKEHPGQNFASTLTFAFVHNKKLNVFQIGDSQLGVFSQTGLEMLPANYFFSPPGLPDRIPMQINTNLLNGPNAGSQRSLATISLEEFFNKGALMKAFKDSHANLAKQDQAKYLQLAKVKFKEIHFKQYPLDDRQFIFATDGLWDNLPAAQVTNILQAPNTGNGQAAADELLCQALANGKKPDDITIAVCQFSQGPDNIVATGQDEKAPTALAANALRSGSKRPHGDDEQSDEIPPPKSARVEENPLEDEEKQAATDEEPQDGPYSEAFEAAWYRQFDSVRTHLENKTRKSRAKVKKIKSFDDIDQKNLLQIMALVLIAEEADLPDLFPNLEQFNFQQVFSRIVNRFEFYSKHRNTKKTFLEMLKMNLGRNGDIYRIVHIMSQYCTNETLNDSLVQFLTVVKGIAPQLLDEKAKTISGHIAETPQEWALYEENAMFLTALTQVMMLP